MIRLASFVFALVTLCCASAIAQQEYATPAGTGVNYETRISALEEQIRTLTGKTEQLDYTIHGMEQSMQRMQGDYEMRLAKLETATVAAPAAPPAPATPPQPQQPATPPPPQTGDNANAAPVVGTLGDLKVQGGQVIGAVKNPKSPPLPNTPPDYGLNPQEQYDRAFDLLRQANYDEAEKAFKAFIDKNPKDKLLDNAKYWYAETFYGRAKFSDAAAAFADAFQQNPQGSKAPDSLLKLAMSLAAMDKTQDACATLLGLKSKYPNAPATLRSRADQEQAQLKCGR